jgi:hypothetical protein
MAGEIADVFGLAFGQAARAERRNPLALHAQRIKRRAAHAAARLLQPLPDRLRGLDRELLADDRACQRGERVAAPGAGNERPAGRSYAPGCA